MPPPATNRKNRSPGAYIRINTVHKIIIVSLKTIKSMNSREKSILGHVFEGTFSRNNLFEVNLFEKFLFEEHCFRETNFSRKYLFEVNVFECYFFEELSFRKNYRGQFFKNNYGKNFSVRKRNSVNVSFVVKQQFKSK